MVEARQVTQQQHERKKNRMKNRKKNLPSNKKSLKRSEEFIRKKQRQDDIKKHSLKQ